ncbi:MAG: stage III sporulation protein AF [Defluviitaleaceae bacterium]|nr:stage III sporulation protein AF [Defluviitaleaceae bacterium]
MTHIADYIRNLAVFIIFSSFISIINPGKKYEQYINLVLGIILIFIIISPLSGIINAFAGSSGDIFADISLSYDRAALARQIEQADQSQRELIISIYKEGLTAQIERLIDNHGYFTLDYASFSIDERENFGEIITIHLFLIEIERARAFIRIDPVRIDPIIGSRGEPRQTGAENQAAPEILSLKNLLSSFYNLDMQNIILEVRP